MRLFCILLLFSLGTWEVRSQTIVLSGFEDHSIEDIRYSFDLTIFNKLLYSQIPAARVISLSYANYNVFILCNYINGHAAYFDLAHLSSVDTFIIEYSDYLSKALPYQFPVFISYNSDLCNNFFKKFSGLNIRIYDVWRSISRKKLKRAMLSGEIYSVPKDIAFDTTELHQLGYQNVEEAWLNLIPFCFSYGNFDLIDDYILNAGDKQSMINGDSWDFTNIREWSYSIFRNQVGPNLKDFIYREFDKIKSSPFPRYQRIKALCLAYNAVSAFGLQELNGGQFAIRRDYFYQQLDAMPQDIYTEEFRRFLVNRVGITLETSYEFTDHGHQRVMIDSFHSKEWLILDFWATWCKPCIKSFPALKEFHKKHQDKAELVSLSVDVSYNSFAKWVQKEQKEYTWAFLHAGNGHPIIHTLGVIAFPTYMIVHMPSRKVSGPFYRVEDLELFFSVQD